MTPTRSDAALPTAPEARMLRPATALLFLSLLAACGARPGAVPAVESHAALSTGLACTGTDAHAKHLNVFACDVCHEATGGRFLFTKVFTFPRGTSTAGGLITRGAGATPTTCTVACHSPMGAAPRTVAWNTPGPLDCTACHDTALLPPAHPAVAANAPRATCAACHVMTGHLDGVVMAGAHGVAWMDQASTGFHAFEANRGLAACQACHGVTLAGQGAAPSCGSCHDQGLPAGIAGWAANCTMCHGGSDNPSGAPPKATWGGAGDPIRVGAHTAHAAGGPLAPAFGCAVCHVTPVDAFAPGHLDPGPAEVAFSGVAVRGPSPAWDRTTGTCSNVYCHGSSLSGGTRTAPRWTGGAAEAACGTCHGAPPPAPHPAAAGLASCAACHPQTMTAAGALIPPAQGGKHLDGVLQFAGGGHTPAWMDTASPGFHAYSANASIASCQGCHGVNLDGVGGSATTACATCHGATWRTSCTMCHGGADSTSGAPPATTWGNGADAVRVGAHTLHLAGSANAPAVACASCHAVPADALSPGHADGGTAEVAMTGLAAASNATPRWNRATASCATTYCHGGYSGTYSYQVYNWGSGTYDTFTMAYAGSGATPSWTGGPMTCTSCHAAPPLNGTWHYPTHGRTANNCDLCHPGVNAAGTGFVNPARHIDGVVDVTPTFKSTCFDCH